MKSKCVSAQNLESLVKQVVNEALEDNEQIIKFRRMIYEEWYFKKWSEPKDTNRKENENISDSVVHRRSNWYKFERETCSSSERNIDPSNDENLRTARSLSENRDKSQGTIVENVSAAKVDGHDKAVTDDNLIEIWHNVPQRAKQKNALNTVSKKVLPRSTDNRSSAKRLNGMSFEAWTANKTLAYRELLKRERLRRISVSRANAERDQERERRRKHRLFSRQIRARKRPQQNLIRATEPNLNFPKKEEDVRFDEGETRMQKTREGARASTPRKGKSASMKIMETFIVDSWLNQLNSILHQRCLGERRHLAQTAGFH